MAKKQATSGTTAKAAGSSGQKPRATRIPLRITDTSLRDAHQSLWATRMRTSDIMEIIDTVDNVGYYSLECWGGATFDVCMRFLRENPWERLRMIKARAKKTPLQMLLRGQNILGYRHYPDDVLERFIALAAENGIDIFRVFDALNDNRNLEKSIKLVRKYGGHAQGTICYTTSPVHTVERFVEIAREQEQMGAESICIKDMAGILSPLVAEKLVTALIKGVSVPIQLHTHATSGMAVASYVEGVRAGAGAIDCSVWSIAGFSSQPPVETLLAIFDETNYSANLDREALARVGKFFFDLRKMREPSIGVGNYIDPDILQHHIPGGMISNLRSQLKQQDALDRLDDVLAELPRTRADLGYPPLVTPTSQIVGVQAVLNVIGGGRYKMIPQETRDYVRGLYGRSPAPINPAVKKKILAGEKSIRKRPADLLEPMLPTAADNLDPKLIRHEEDILSYCLFPEPALAYFLWREASPADRPPVPADLEDERQTGKAAPVAEAQPGKPLMAPTDYTALQGLLNTVKQLGIVELTIRRPDASVTMKGSSAASAPVAATEPLEEFAAAAPLEETTPRATPDEPEKKSTLPTIDSPLTGTFYRTAAVNQPPIVEEGGRLKKGAPICIVEAMKLFNQIKVEKDCRVVKFLIEHGAVVQKGQPLAEVEYM